MCVEIDMKISEVNSTSKNVSVEGKIIKLETTRVVNTRYGQRRVANAILQDESGSIKLSLWEADIEKVAEGKTVAVENGFISEWNKELQLSLGRNGKLIVK